MVDEAAVLDVVKSRNVQTYFQPVVSLAARSIVGFEAFSRGGGAKEGGPSMEPSALFHCGLSPETKINVDRLCRETALAQFKPIHRSHRDLLLFLNVNTDILPFVDMQTQVLKHQVTNMGLDLADVVVEVPLRVALGKEVVRFAEAYREMGFKLSLDNCGAGDGLENILGAVRPAFLKISPALYGPGRDLDGLKRLVESAGRLGAMVVGQGVESEEASIRLLSAGVHLQQGYYYSKDGDGAGDQAQSFARKIQAANDKYKLAGRSMVRQRKEQFQAMFRTVGTVCSRLASLGEARFEDACRAMVRVTRGVVSVFVLNDKGLQITSRPHAEGGAKAISASLLGSARGVDHSVHDYFLYLDMGYEKFVTQPFISPFTGAPVRLITRSIYNSEGSRYVVCVETALPE
ncbi:EAL domain-containing protein [Pseudodesulfovibrio sp.]|uniref:EAL domain-containing protein n=1 Tax=Pseudodesulfovibrio sp. TaxID=2035812 RepID=UPI002632F036|nr:EAL domain-containing protein [Pseudodesulfovibrio sp.]MDD3311048.1 EAL domain-containing protein [Pseudodesulfovibrio sp.]